MLPHYHGLAGAAGPDGEIETDIPPAGQPLPTGQPARAWAAWM
jgi:hypothetical protein